METARALTENLVSLLRREHHALAEFLVALADFDRRRLWVDLGHSSLWYFLHRELRLSKSGAQYRKVAAELIQEIPGIVEPLRRGDLCLTGLIEVAKVVTSENWELLLPRFYGLSRREAAEVVAELQPHPAPPVRTVITAVRSALASRGAAPVRELELIGSRPREVTMHEPWFNGAATQERTPSAAYSRIVSSSEEPVRCLARSAPPVTEGANLLTPIGFAAPTTLATPRATQAKSTTPAIPATATTPTTPTIPATIPATAATPAAEARPCEVVPLTADRVEST